MKYDVSSSCCNHHCHTEPAQICPAVNSGSYRAGKAVRHPAFPKADSIILSAYQDRLLRLKPIEEEIEMKKIFTSLALATVLTASSFTAYAAPEQALRTAAVTPSAQAVALVNAERGAVGLPALSEDQTLDAVSCVRAVEMDAEFSHTRPDGTQWYTALDAVDASRFTKVSIGETLARG